MSKRERRIIIGLVVAIVLLVVVAGGLSYSIDYNKRLQVVRSNTQLTITTLMNQITLTNEAKTQD